MQTCLPFPALVRYEPPAGVPPPPRLHTCSNGVERQASGGSTGQRGGQGLPANRAKSRRPCIHSGEWVCPLGTEEELIAEGQSNHGARAVRLSDFRTLPRISRQVRGRIESTVESDLISPDFRFFIPGLTLSLQCFLAALVPEMQILRDSGGSGGIIIPAFVSLAFLLSTIRTCLRRSAELGV